MGITTRSISLPVGKGRGGLDAGGQEAAKPGEIGIVTLHSGAELVGISTLDRDTSLDEFKLPLPENRDIVSIFSRLGVNILLTTWQTQMDAASCWQSANSRHRHITSSSSPQHCDSNAAVGAPITPEEIEGMAFGTRYGDVEDVEETDEEDYAELEQDTHPHSTGEELWSEPDVMSEMNADDECVDHTVGAQEDENEKEEEVKQADEDHEEINKGGVSQALSPIRRLGRLRKSSQVDGQVHTDEQDEEVHEEEASAATSSHGQCSNASHKFPVSFLSYSGHGRTTLDLD